LFEASDADRVEETSGELARHIGVLYSSMPTTWKMEFNKATAEVGLTILAGDFDIMLTRTLSVTRKFHGKV
jgi:hypothetical protein